MNIYADAGSCDSRSVSLCWSLLPGTCHKHTTSKCRPKWWFEGYTVCTAQKTQDSNDISLCKNIFIHCTLFTIFTFMKDGTVCLSWNMWEGIVTNIHRNCSAVKCKYLTARADAGWPLALSERKSWGFFLVWCFIFASKPTFKWYHCLWYWRVLTVILKKCYTLCDFLQHTLEFAGEVVAPGLCSPLPLPPLLLPLSNLASILLYSGILSI